MSKTGKPGSEGKVVMLFSVLITWSPAIIGPILVATTCGENAQFNCAPYYWWAYLLFTIPVGLIIGIIGLVMYLRDKKSSKDS